MGTGWVVVQVKRKHWNRKTLQNHLGKKCCNCGSEEDVQYHHIVELAAGGNDVIANIAPLCGTCHAMHHSLAGLKNHSLLIKRGLEKQKEKGKYIGRPYTTVDDMPVSFFRYYPAFVAGSLNKAEFARICKLSRPTLDRYLRIVEREHDIDKIKFIERRFEVDR